MAQEVTDENENKYGYVKTKLGETLGTAFAGKILNLSYQHPETSLYEIFGSTVSTAKPGEEGDGFKKRSPLTHLFIQVFTKLRGQTNIFNRFSRKNRRDRFNFSSPPSKRFSKSRYCKLRW